MKKRLYNYVLKNGPVLTLLNYLSMLIPKHNKLNKYKNIIKVLKDIHYQNSEVKSSPIHVRIAPIAACNYKCLFCEIHKDDLLYPNRSKNIITLNNIYSYEALFKSAYSLSFYGGSGEPLLNVNFGKIVEYLKTKYSLKMMVNTNGSMMNEEMSKILVKHRFDDILLSYHAGSKDTYKHLMTGDIDRVDKNIKFLQELKQKNSTNLPILKFNFALHKDNAKDSIQILDKAKKFSIDHVLVSRYHGGRNKLQDNKISYEYDLENGKKELDSIYDYATKNSISLIPPRADYWKKYEDISWDSENFNKKSKCLEPWKNIHFNPVLDAKDTHFVGVCNRIELFKLNYEKLNLSNKDNFKKVWNHPILKYMRETVNDSDNINPICKYCKNFERESLRNIDSTKYAKVRDDAVEEFFAHCQKNLNYQGIEGLQILSDNPSSDSKFTEKLKEL